jgi:hypothetical protein
MTYQASDQVWVLSSDRFDRRPPCDVRERDEAQVSRRQYHGVIGGTDKKVWGITAQGEFAVDRSALQRSSHQSRRPTLRVRNYVADGATDVADTL